MGNGQPGTSGVASMVQHAYRTKNDDTTHWINPDYYSVEGTNAYSIGNLNPSYGQFRYGGSGFIGC